MRVRFLKEYNSATTIYKKHRLYDTREYSKYELAKDLTVVDIVFMDGDSLMAVPDQDIEVFDDNLEKQQQPIPIDYSRPCCDGSLPQKPKKKK